MRQISKVNQTQIDEAVKACETAAAALNEKIEDFNEWLEKQREPLNDAVREYNEKVADLKSVYEDIASDAHNYFDERTETWQEGEKGQAYQEWLDALDDPDIQEIEIEIPADLETPDNIPDFSDDSWLPPSAPGE